MPLRLITGLASTLGLSSFLYGGALELGAPLPEVSANTHTGETIQLNEFGKSGFTFVYFYPKADTPGCTKQACSLRDAYEALTEQNVSVLAVSRDNAADQKAFAEKYKLPFTLIADENGDVCEAFKVPNYPGVKLSKRQAFLFKDGKLIWLDLKASTAKQSKDVLEVLSKQKSE